MSQKGVVATPLMSRFQDLDAYAKTLDDFRTKTTSGAVLTVLSAVLIALLVSWEFASYLAVDIRPQMSVDPDRAQRMEIHINVTMHKIPCFMLGMHVMDVSGEEQMDTSHEIFKTRIDKWGKPLSTEREESLGQGTAHGGKDAKALIVTRDPNYCGSCYGAPSPNGNNCCNSCDEVQQAYLSKGWVIQDIDQIEQCVKEGVADRIKEQYSEGCNLHGTINVQRVSGNFHFAVGRTFVSASAHLHDLAPFLTKDFDFSHTVDRIAFGEDFSWLPPGPLDGTSRTAPKENANFQYFIKVVGTRAIYLNGTSKRSNQYAVTTHERKLDGQQVMPGLFFHYEISPLLITYTETRRNFFSFLTSVCAIIGGVFTVASILDAWIYRAEKAIREKRQLGKLS